MKCMSLFSFVHAILIEIYQNAVAVHATQNQTRGSKRKRGSSLINQNDHIPFRFLVPFFFVDNILSGFHFKEEAQALAKICVLHPSQILVAITH